jgi:hypothetical protein
MKHWKLDREITATMVEDMLFDPILAAKVLLRIKIPPHEELRILWMWSTYYTSDDSGFSTGKSWTLALIAALRSILMRNRVSGILSKTFAQGKLIFGNLDRWYVSAPLFRTCIKHHGSKPRLVHGGDAWQAFFRGGSEIRVLPPSFLQESERIKSERWHDGYFDEWVTYGNFAAFNTTVIGRVTNTNYFPDCPVRQNHIHLASTPGFQHEPSYQMIKRVDYQLAIKNKDYGRFTVNYRHIPKKPAWNFLLNRKTIFHMQTNNPKGIVRGEVDGLWEKDSGSYYNSDAVQAVRMKSMPLIRARMAAGEWYFGGGDVARGGGDTVSANQGDDFAFSVLRVVNNIPHLILTIRKSKVTADQMSAIIHKINRLFGLSLIVLDPGGGGLFVRDKLRESMQLIDNAPMVCSPILTPLDTSGTIGSEILSFFARGDYFIERAWGKMASDSVLINRLHQEVKASIEQGKMVLPGEWDGWKNEFKMFDVGAKREWLNRNASSMPEEEVLKAERDLTVLQLVHVDYARDKNQIPLIDSFGMYDFKSKKKKDAAYSFIYSYMAFLLHRWLVESGMSTDQSDDNSSEGFIAVEAI